MGMSSIVSKYIVSFSEKKYILTQPVMQSQTYSKVRSNTPGRLLEVFPSSTKSKVHPSPTYDLAT